MGSPLAVCFRPITNKAGGNEGALVSVCQKVWCDEGSRGIRI